MKPFDIKYAQASFQVTAGTVGINFSRISLVG